MQVRYLFEISDLNSKQNKEVEFKYSLFKHGERDAILYFSQLLSKKIAEDQLILNKKDWIITTVPYLGLSHPTQALCSDLSKTLRVPFVESFNTQTFNGGGNYQLISSKEMREKVVSSIKISYENKKDVEGKKVLLVDDAITSGSMINHLKTLLLKDFSVNQVDCYTILKISSEDHAFENKISMLLMEPDFETHLVRVINDPSSILNRLVVKNVFLAEEYIFEKLVAKFTPMVRIQLSELAQKLFGTELIDRISYMRTFT